MSSQPLPPPREDIRFTVVGKHHRTPVIVELVLQPEEGALDYRAGQYVLVGDVDYVRTVRSYSVANAPGADGVITLLVTLVPDGELSGWLHALVEGDEVLVSGPYGTFVDRPESDDPILFLAGGSGLAPIRALAEAGLARPQPPSMTLLFSARTEADLVDDERFRCWEAGSTAFRYLRTLTRQHGPPPVGHVPEVLADLVPPLEEHLVYIAGGSGFVAACAEAARGHGAGPGRVLTEEFFVDPRPW